MSSKSNPIGIIGLSLITGAIAGYVSAHYIPAPSGATMSASSTAGAPNDQLKQSFKSYLMDNPKDIIDSLQKWQMTQETDRTKQQLNAVAELSDHFAQDHHYGMAGNPKGNITIVEFFDYNCPACKMMFESLDSLLKEDKNVRVLFVEYPIFGPVSDMNARIATALVKLAPEKYYDFHVAMIRQKGKTNEEQAYQIAGNLGVDVAKLKAEVAKPDGLQLLQKDRELGAKLQIQGTPAVIIGKHMVNSALPIEELKKQVAQARAQAKDGSDAPASEPEKAPAATAPAETAPTMPENTTAKPDADKD